ncbi:hypothetical protein GPL06_18545 [Bacteroides salyersiae]|uniref:hypothetical protein n=1 Tax=Bacteroides salyersiae TaxID=291644 RepID=UPI001C02081F|nr:hypothetical protein [Bacteroides salyersiae]MBT9874765.1 hypothetical protein [Bacteroides salyersiae]
MDRDIITISEAGAITIPTAPVWMTQFEIADLFGIFSCDIRKAIHSIYKNKELDEVETQKYIRQADGISYDVYNIEMIIAIAFRVCSKKSVLFRQFIINKISTATKKTPITLFVSCSRGNNLWYS